MNNSNELDQKLADLLASVFDIDRGLITAASSVDNVQGWDSVNHMHLVVVLEEEFGIEFKDDEAVELISFELIRSYLKEKLPAYRD
jgi:acyl carrier protein